MQRDRSAGDGASAGGETPAALERPRAGGTSPGATPAASLEARGRALHALIEDLARRIFDAHGVPESERRALRLDLEAEISPAARRDADPGAATRFSKTIIDKLHALALERGSGDGAAPPGRIHCYWCGSFDCAHSRPPDARAAFAGYSPTGQPCWTEFGALALDRSHPLIECLYAAPPTPITLLVRGSELSKDQLAIYGKGSGRWQILGQLLVGYVTLQEPATSDAGRRGHPRSALSIQIVETRSTRRSRFDLNVLALSGGGEPLGAYIDGHLDPRLSDALAAARKKLRDMDLGLIEPEAGGRGGRRRRGRGFAEKERAAMRLLERLARNLVRIFRQGQRRTRHGEDRHRNRARPASSALRDALSAGASEILRDSQEGTWIVVGPRCRVHVFNDAGQHVTSVHYPGDTVRRRTQQGKWRPVADAAALESFRELLRGAAPLDDAPGEDGRGGG